LTGARGRWRRPKLKTLAMDSLLSRRIRKRAGGARKAMPDEVWGAGPLASAADLKASNDVAYAYGGRIVVNVVPHWACSGVTSSPQPQEFAQSGRGESGIGGRPGTWCKDLPLVQGKMSLQARLRWNGRACRAGRAFFAWSSGRLALMYRDWSVPIVQARRQAS